MGRDVEVAGNVISRTIWSKSVYPLYWFRNSMNCCKTEVTNGAPNSRQGCHLTAQDQFDKGRVTGKSIMDSLESHTLEEVSWWLKVGAGDRAGSWTVVSMRQYHSAM